MTRLVVADWDQDGVITAETVKPNIQQANGAAAVMISEGYVNAFHVSFPSTIDRNRWRVSGNSIVEGPKPPESPTELDRLENHLRTDRVERRKIGAEARRRGVSPESIINAILAES